MIYMTMTQAEDFGLFEMDAMPAKVVILSDADMARHLRDLLS